MIDVLNTINGLPLSQKISIDKNQTTHTLLQENLLNEKIEVVDVILFSKLSAYKRFTIVTPPLRCSSFSKLRSIKHYRDC